jgi:hypothetical protein
MRAVRAWAEQPTCASRGLGTVLPLSVLCLFGLVQTLATSCDATAPGNLCSTVMTETPAEDVADTRRPPHIVRRALDGVARGRWSHLVSHPVSNR